MQESAFYLFKFWSGSLIPIYDIEKNYLINVTLQLHSWNWLMVQVVLQNLSQMSPEIIA